MKTVGMQSGNRTRRTTAVVAAFVVFLALSAGVAAQQAAQPQQGNVGYGMAMTNPLTLQIHVKGADIRDVLRMLSDESRKNIVATKEVTGEVSADLYNVTFTEALHAVLNSSGYAYRQQGNVIYIYTQRQLAEILKAERKTVSRAFRLAYITAADAQALITPSLSEVGLIAVSPAANMGIETSKTEAGGNAYASEDVLIVTDYEENVAVIADILAKLDVMPPQVLIEATILRATLTEDNALGIDFNVLAGVDFSDLGAKTSDLTQLTFSQGGVNVSGLPQSWRRSAVNTNFASVVPSGGLSIGLINNDVAFFIRALESITDVNILLNTKLTIINKQRGEIMVGNRDGYLTTTVTDTVATQTVQFLETGTRLVVRPYVARDGNVRLEIHPEDSSGSVDVVGTNVLPSETTTEVTSNILVRDGHTVVIGGLFRERTSAGRSQVPLLGNIPYIGALWRNTLDNSTREEVIILVTPHILVQSTDDAVSAQLADDTERFRTGLRKGLRWWGRNRLSQTHMRWARDAMNAGDPAKALWNVDMALSLEPKMIHAIRLREELTDRAYWADEYRWSSVKYLIPRMLMQDLGRPVDMVIPPDRPRKVDMLPADVMERFGLAPEPEGEQASPASSDIESLEKEILPEGVDADSAEPEDLKALTDEKTEATKIAETAPKVEAVEVGPEKTEPAYPRPEFLDEELIEIKRGETSEAQTTEDNTAGPGNEQVGAADSKDDGAA